MHKLKVSVISKDKIAYKGEADALFVPTQTGIIEVLPEHMQLVSALQKGDIIVKNDGKEIFFKITGGVLEVRTKSEVVILADVVIEE